MSREQLQTQLETILGSRNVYFSPPENVKLKYPCFIYKKLRPHLKRANDKVYIHVQCYQVTYITKDPDSGIENTMLDIFEMCSHEQTFISDSLCHEVFNLYY